MNDEREMNDAVDVDAEQPAVGKGFDNSAAPIRKSTGSGCSNYFGVMLPLAPLAVAEIT